MLKYGKVVYGPRDCFCKPRRFPMSVLAYHLGINVNHPRVKRPWGDLTGKITDNNFPRRRRSRLDRHGPTP